MFIYFLGSGQFVKSVCKQVILKGGEKNEGYYFALDGVICSTDNYHFQAWKELADSMGIYFDERINNRLRGVSRMASLEIVLERGEKRYSQEEKEQMADKKMRFIKNCLNRCRRLICLEK